MRMNFEEIKKLDSEYVLQTYGRYPIALEKGKGCKVWDVEGKEYLDLIGGIACLPLGHSHPNMVKAIKEQSEKLTHISNLYYNENQAQFAKLLNDLAPMKTKTFFSNSGAEANEAAIKVVRKHTKKSEVLYMTKSFHGRTLNTLSITDKEKYRAPFRPLMPGTKVIDYGSIEALKNNIGDNTGAVFTELIQGESGVVFPRNGFEESKEYFKEMREVCDDNDVLMVVDEVQTGAGRTGSFFASTEFDVMPDIITTAKGVAGGFPIGATLVQEDIACCMNFGDHGSTFGGGPLACAAGIATVNTLQDEKLMDNAKKVGSYMLDNIGFGDARGLGLMVGVEMGEKERAQKTMEKARETGILVNVTGNSIIRMLPPLTLSKEEADSALNILTEVSE
jgi:acetylornithine/N-succinyldiaminopimelate aminotransferase